MNFNQLKIPLIFLIIFTLLPFFVGKYFLYTFTIFLIWILLASSLDFLVGHTGEISLAHGAFWGIGGYSVVLLNSLFHIEVLLAILISLLFSGFLLLLIGSIIFRTKGFYFAILTLSINVAFTKILEINPLNLTGGGSGIGGLPRPSILGFSLTSDMHFYFFLLFIVFFFLLLKVILMGSHFGWACKAISLNEEKAASLGIPITKTKTLSFVFSSLGAVLGGGLLASFVSFVSPTFFEVISSFYILVAVIIGGMGTILGPILGAGLIAFVPTILFVPPSIKPLISGIILLTAILFLPKGIADLPKKIKG